MTIFLALTVVPAGAHMLWLNPADCFPAVGSTVDIGIGWGHEFPANRVHQEVKDDRIADIQALDPDGKAVALVKAAVDRYQLKIEKAGAYVVTARIKPGFFTMTPKGRQWGNKKEVADAAKCTNFHIEAKTVLIAGKGVNGQKQAAGRTVEVIPVSDLNNLKSGASVDMQALYQGAPLAEADVKAVYAGFKEKAHDHGDAAKGKGHGEHHYPVETKTNAQGVASISLDRPGHWLVIVSHRPDYQDKETCDQYMYNVTYALEVKK